MPKLDCNFSLGFTSESLHTQGVERLVSKCGIFDKENVAANLAHLICWRRQKNPANWGEQKYKHGLQNLTSFLC